MGLDISHDKFTLEPNEESDYIIIDDWDINCNVPLEAYSNFITLIDQANHDKNIAVFKDEHDYECLIKAGSITEKDYIKVFFGQYDNRLQKNIQNYIKSQSLHKIDSFELDVERAGIKYHSIFFGEMEKIEGLYYNEIGTQRKGMSELFYEHFRKYLFWGNKEDFDLAFSCLDGGAYLEAFGQKYVIEMQEKFSKNFVEQFVFGQSLLTVSF
jgi:hypothetical protein